jgi:CheY-like chemotaxis protein
MSERKKMALVVDDDETLRLVASRQLSKLGFSVQHVSNGREAVDAFKSGDYDLILMDLQMPEMDGYEATREIRQIEVSKPRRKAVIVAITASQEQDRAITSGMNDYLFKPFMFEAMRRVVEKHFP